MDSKFRFLKPADSSSLAEEKKDEDEREVSSFVYNPAASFSIEHQRQRLPIFKYRNHILNLLEKYQTLIIVGETGCGKSTQIPQFMMEAGWTKDNSVIGITQPRRIAAKMLAERVALETGFIVGEEVGYSIRFGDCYDPRKTKIKYMTEGILVREMMSDPLLRSYCALMLDEVHERTLYTDIVLGLMKKILKRQKNLRLIVSSATLEAEVLCNFFNYNETNLRSKDTAFILSVGGKMYPVDIFYLSEPCPDYVKASVDTVIKIHEQEKPGDVLVFLTGQQEVLLAVRLLIEYARELKHKKGSSKLLVLPMYGSLPAAEQLKVFEPVSKGVRKVVIATNIAETSITISGITYVVDCGFVKVRYYNTHASADSLVIIPISQASAEQRAGRAGRVKSGKAYRLYTEEDFHKLEFKLVPEIQRSSLCTAILQLKALGIKNILRFNFPDSPPSENVISGLELLYALKAIDDNGDLTKPLGMMMAEFPLHPMFAKMLLISGEMGCSEESLTIASMLQVENVFLSVPGKRNEAAKAKHKFSVKEGDQITLLNIYNSFLKYKRNKNWCDENYINYKSLIRAMEIRNQLAKMLSRFKIPIVSCDGDVQIVCQCIVAGFFANAAYLHYSGNYRTVKGDHKLHIHPTSVLYTITQPQWVVFNEVLHTTEEYMKDITVIKPEWLYELAPQYYQYGTDREISEQRHQIA